MSTDRIAQAALGVMALHVADDSFLQPAAGTRPRDHLGPASCRSRSSRSPRGPPAPPPRRRRGRAALALGALRRRARRRGRLLLGCDRAVRRRLHRPARRGSPASCCSASSAAVLWTSRRPTTGRAPGAGRGARSLTAGAVVVSVLVGPVLLAYGVTHITRAEIPAAHLGVPYEDVTLHTADGLDLARLVHPLAQRRGGHRLPGPGEGPEARSLPGPRRLRRPPGRPSRRGRQRRRPARLRLDVRRGHPGGRQVPPGPRRRGAGAGSPASASRSAAR